MKIDKNGNFLWSKAFEGYNSIISFSSQLRSVQELPDRSIYICGPIVNIGNPTSAGPTLFAKLDSGGNLLWSKSYDDSISYGGGTPFTMVYDTITQLFDISATLVLYNGSVVGDLGMFNFIIDTSGNVKFLEEYAFPNDIGFMSGFGSTIIPISGGGYALLSSSYISNDSETTDDFYFVKSDQSGRTNTCNITRNPRILSYPMRYHNYNIYVNSVTPSVVSGYANAAIEMTDTSYCPPFVANFSYFNVCVDTIKFYDSTYQYPASWQWDFGEPGSASNTSNLKNPVHVYAKSGTYTVRLIAGNGSVFDTAIKKITIGSPIPFRFDTLICGGKTITLRASGGATYKWSAAKLVSNATSATPTVTPKRTTNFIVEAISAQGCITNDTVHVTVDSKPGAPQIEYSTVKTNSEIDVKFQRSDSNDVSAYEVFKSVNGGAYSLLQTIKNLSNTDSIYFVKDSSVNATTNKYAYKIVAEDSCGALSDTSIVHQTMVLAVKQLGCTQTLRLNWNSYIGWASLPGGQTGVKDYEIFRSTNSGADSLIGSVSNSITTYNDTGLNHNNIYCYKIVALDKADSFVSQSNTVCKQTFFPDTPQVLSASKISTSTTNGTIVIKWNSINKANLAYNLLYFSRDGKNFTQTGGHFLPGVDSFSQTGLDTKDSDYFYYLVTVDSCGAQSVKSPTAKP